MVATQDEIRRAIEALSLEERKSLMWLARQLVARIGVLAGGREDEDFVHEAIEATLAGSRLWNKKYSMRDHLRWVIRSEVSNHAQHHKSQRYQEPILVSSLNAEHEEDLDNEVRAKTADDFPSALPSPEEELELKRREIILDKIKRHMAALLGQHSMGEKVFQLQIEGLSGPEICQRLKITKPQYAIYNMQIVRTTSKIRKRNLEGLL
ncbi:MAG TPA: hypothetical protein DCQ94_13265 [Nitrospira sp.]|nr:hypothetical protein [Nitrospira sp.]